MRRTPLAVPALLLAPLLWVELVRALVGAPLRPADLLARLLFVASTLALARAGAPRPAGDGRWAWPWPSAAVVAVALAAALWYALGGATLAAWALVAAAYAALTWAVQVLRAPLPRLARPLLPLVAAGLVGLAAVALVQVEGRFSDEELFVAVEALSLGGLWWWLWVASGALTRALARPALRGRMLSPPRVGLTLALVALASGGAAWLSLRAYQASFFPATAPAFAGITAEAPMRCGEVPAPARTYEGRAVFARLLALLDRHPFKGAPEYGMLALGYGDRARAEAFRAQLLAEAVAGRFSGPANSVKYIQYEAAARVYYYDRVRAAFPSLFTPEEEATVAAWFAAINRRALTVEWVDWAYSMALGAWPEGPYANQESGSGLLAILTATGLGDPALDARNQDYLARNPGGWELRFRNTDDAVIYQPEWITNALYRRLAGAPAPDAQLRRSVDWLFAQALPDGAPLRYNYPEAQSSDGSAYLAATLLGDPRYLWLAGRALEGRAATLGYTGSQPGVEAPMDGVGAAPTLGSCLLFSDSGMPNQAGPLAPDKIVLRDGWEASSTYALLNLRFTGWHRYKATNTLALVYGGGPLVAEQLEGETPAWMPRGRRYFRDKRIPRENLSGLLVGRIGLDAVTARLTGIGDAWAQDPPFYAEVEAFVTAGAYDHSVTTLHDWNGWTQRRALWLYHGGPLIVYDQAEGPAGTPAAISWNLPAATLAAPGRVSLAGGASPAELVVLGAGATTATPQPGGALRLIAAPAAPGRIAQVSVLLTGPWEGAEVTLGAAGTEVLISKGARRLVVPLDGALPGARLES